MIFHSPIFAVCRTGMFFLSSPISVCDPQQSVSLDGGNLFWI